MTKNDDDTYIPFEGRGPAIRIMTGEEAKRRIEIARRNLEKIKKHQSENGKN